MKRAFQHIVLGLFCFVGLVLAAPNWFITHAKPMSNAWHTMVSQNKCDSVPADNSEGPQPSILEGTARFACW